MRQGTYFGIIIILNYIFSFSVVKAITVYDQINQLRGQIDANNTIITNNAPNGLTPSNSQQQIDNVCTTMRQRTSLCITNGFYHGSLTASNFGCDSNGDLSTDTLSILSGCQCGTGTSCSCGYCYLQEYYNIVKPTLLDPALSVRNAAINNASFQQQISLLTPKERLQSCILSSPNGVALDGSNCQENLLCDSALLVCILTTETACLGNGKGGGCAVGQKCVINSDSQISQVAGGIGVCVIEIKNATEENAIEQIICNVYKLANGKVGKGLLVLVIFVVGIKFYLSQISWSSLIGILIGIGLSFGGAQITSVFLGKEFICK